MLQNLLAAMLVIACGAYAAGSLMPASWRRALAHRLLRWRLPAGVQRRLRSAALAPTACGCSGCERAPAPTDGVHPVRLHPRRPRP